MSLVFIILAELALDTILLLRQLVFCTYTLFGTLKIRYGYGRVVIAVLGSIPITDDLIFLCQIFFLKLQYS